jgi:hypothetical protein
MKRAVQKNCVILSLVLLCMLCLFVQLTEAYYALPMPGYSGGMVPPVFSPFSSGLFGAPYKDLFPLFPTLSGVSSIYGPNTLFPGLDSGFISTSVDDIIQINPGSDIQGSKWNDLGSLNSPYGFGNLFGPIEASSSSYCGLQYPAMDFPGISLPGIGIPGIVIPGIGFPGMILTGIGLPEIGPLGMGLPGIGLPWMWDPGARFPVTGFTGSEDKDTALQQYTDVSVDHVTTSTVDLFDPFGNLLSELPIGALPDPIINLIPTLPVIPPVNLSIPPVNLSVPPVNLSVPPVDLSIPLASITNCRYVAATIEGITQTIHILLMDDGEDSILPLEDILNEGIYCIKVKNLPIWKLILELSSGHGTLNRGRKEV